LGYKIEPSENAPGGHSRANLHDLNALVNKLLQSECVVMQIRDANQAGQSRHEDVNL